MSICICFVFPAGPNRLTFQIIQIGNLFHRYISYLIHCWRKSFLLSFLTIKLHIIYHQASFHTPLSHVSINILLVRANVAIVRCFQSNSNPISLIHMGKPKNSGYPTNCDCLLSYSKQFSDRGADVCTYRPAKSNRMIIDLFIASTTKLIGVIIAEASKILTRCGTSVLVESKYRQSLGKLFQQISAGVK